MTSQRWQWSLLRAGSFRLDGGSMFGVVPRTIWSRLTPSDEHNRIPLQTNCLLLYDGSTRVLIECGFGGKWSDRERSFYDLERRTIRDAIVETGVDPAEIDHVIVTHLHFDHAGGLTEFDRAGKPVPTFPNAVIHVQLTEWNNALANKSTMTRTYLPEHLDPVTSSVRCIKGEGEVVPGITVWPMPGHTWGQQSVRFHDNAGIVCFPGDVLPTVQHVGAAFSMGYDMEPYTNMRSKLDLLRLAEAENWRLVLDHEPDNPVVLVNRDPDRSNRFTLKPVDL